MRARRNHLSRLHLATSYRQATIERSAAEALPEAALQGYSAADAIELSSEALSIEVPTAARWEGAIVMEDELTGDGRMIQGNALTWAEDLAEHPLPFRFVVEDVGAHANAVVCGGIDTLERRDGGVVWGSGPLYMDTEHGQTAYRAIKNNQQTGVSVDLDDVAFEVRIAKEIVEEADAFWDAMMNDEPVEEPERETDEDGRVIVAKVKPDDEIMVTTSARLRAATNVAIPAFADARVSIVEGSDAQGDVGDDDGDTVHRSSNAGDTEHLAADTAEAVADLDQEAEALVASGGPIAPPSSWFNDPRLDGPTPLVVEDDGRIYGHLASWNVCHVASPAGEGICVMAPRSQQAYSTFMSGTLKTKEAELISVGRITMGTGHAGPRANALEASAHYDNTGLAVADVRAGEDAHGIWVAGALRPGVGPERIRQLRASPLSGDWRKVNGNLELFAALAVNAPGFPIPRPNGLVASGALGHPEDAELVSLVAAGMLAPKRVRPSELSAGDLSYLKRAADRERQHHRAELAARAERSKNQMKVRAFAAKKGR